MQPHRWSESRGRRHFGTWQGVWYLVSTFPNSLHRRQGKDAVAKTAVSYGALRASLPHHIDWMLALQCSFRFWSISATHSITSCRWSPLTEASYRAMMAEFWVGIFQDRVLMHPRQLQPPPTPSCLVVCCLVLQNHIMYLNTGEKHGHIFGFQEFNCDVIRCPYRVSDVDRRHEGIANVEILGCCLGFIRSRAEGQPYYGYWHLAPYLQSNSFSYKTTISPASFTSFSSSSLSSTSTAGY